MAETEADATAMEEEAPKGPLEAEADDEARLLGRIWARFGAFEGFQGLFKRVWTVQEWFSIGPGPTAQGEVVF